MGTTKQNRELTRTTPFDSAWKQAAKQLFDAIRRRLPMPTLPQEFPELVIVPDGYLWYVPFEALQVNVAKTSCGR